MKLICTGASIKLISSWRCLLAKPIKFVFNIDMSKDPFLELSKSFFLSRPLRPLLEPQRWLDKVLRLLQLDRFCINLSFKDLYLIKSFSVLLEPLVIVGELHSILRDKGYIVIGKNFDYVKIFPNLNLLLRKC